MIFAHVLHTRFVTDSLKNHHTQCLVVPFSCSDRALSESEPDISKEVLLFLLPKVRWALMINEDMDDDRHTQHTLLPRNTATYNTTVRRLLAWPLFYSTEVTATVSNFSFLGIRQLFGRLVVSVVISFCSFGLSVTLPYPTRPFRNANRLQSHHVTSHHVTSHHTRRRIVIFRSLRKRRS